MQIGRVAIDHKEADAGAVMWAAGCSRRDDQFVGPGCRHHRRLGAAQNVAVALTPRRRGDMAEVVTRTPFRPGQRPDRLTGHDLRQPGFTLRRRAGVLDQAARKNHGLDKRLDHEVTAELLHDDHGRQWPAAKTADGFRERRGEQAEFGERFPLFAAEALFARDDLAACIEIILVAEQTLHA